MMFTLSPRVKVLFLLIILINTDVELSFHVPLSNTISNVLTNDYLWSIRHDNPLSCLYHQRVSSLDKPPIGIYGRPADEDLLVGE